MGNGTPCLHLCMDDDGEDLLGGKIEEAQLDPGCVSRMHPVAFGQLLSAVIFTPNGREGPRTCAQVRIQLTKV